MKKPLNIICWKWEPLDGVVSTNKVRKYNAQDVNILYSMLKEHLHIPFNLICVTDDSIGIHKDIKIIPIWDEFRAKGGCFVRLVAFKKDISLLFGDRFVSIDLDCIIVSGITELFDRDDSFIIWGGHIQHRKDMPYCGSLWMMDSGSRSIVYDTFNPDEYTLNKNNRYKGGTDQKHIATVLPNENTWTKKDGLYAFRDIQHKTTLPKNAKIIFFNGKQQPDSVKLYGHTWLEEYNKKYRQITITNKINILCCQWGTKFNDDYVNTLYASIKRNTKIPFKFWCLSESCTQPYIVGEINYYPMQMLSDVKNTKVLNKLFAYDFANVYLNGERVFVFDLDTVVVGNLDGILSYPGKFCMRENFQQKGMPGGDLLSFVGGFGGNWYRYINKYINKVIKRTKGSERAFYIQFTKQEQQYWQDLYPNQYISYKNHIRNNHMPNGCSLVSCHGHPMPHEINEPFIKEHWRV